MYSGSRKICERDESGSGDLNVQMNEFPEGHVKVPSWELFILHIAKSSWLARGRLSRRLFQKYKYETYKGGCIVTKFASVTVPLSFCFCQFIIVSFYSLN